MSRPASGARQAAPTDAQLKAVIDAVYSLLPAIATLAFIGSMESLLSSSVLSIASQTRFDSNRELIAQGLSNVAVAAIGGAVSCGAPFRGVANYAAGGRTRLLDRLPGGAWSGAHR